MVIIDAIIVWIYFSFYNSIDVCFLKRPVKIKVNHTLKLRDTIAISNMIIHIIIVLDKLYDCTSIEKKDSSSFSIKSPTFLFGMYQIKCYASNFGLQMDVCQNSRFILLYRSISKFQTNQDFLSESEHLFFFLSKFQTNQDFAV